MSEIPEQLVKEFNETSELAKSLPNGVTNPEKLQLYAHFKQANEGDVNTDKPGMMDFTGRAKWTEWEKLKGMSKQAAMEKYIQIYKELKAKYA
ncbi:Acyl-CoA-binding domain-containing protein 2 [Coemansia sp. RSA 2336]|nr:Acyl-CoA-binding domain-containing protein 2 [Coemansia sp. RSA 2336]